MSPTGLQSAEVRAPFGGFTSDSWPFHWRLFGWDVPILLQKSVARIDEQ
jgi:hypothetical protein